MIAGATQVLRGTPADQVDPFKLAGALSGDSGWALVLGHQAEASDMLLLKGGRILACARCTAKGHTGVGVESVKDRHRNHGHASETQVRLFHTPDLLLRWALIALRTTPCIRIHPEKMSRRLIEKMLASTGCRTGILERYEFEDGVPMISLQEYNPAQGLKGRGGSAFRGLMMLYEMDETAGRLALSLPPVVTPAESVGNAGPPVEQVPKEQLKLFSVSAPPHAATITLDETEDERRPVRRASRRRSPSARGGLQETAGGVDADAPACPAPEPASVPEPARKAIDPPDAGEIPIVEAFSALLVAFRKKALGVLGSRYEKVFLAGEKKVRSVVPTFDTGALQATTAPAILDFMDAVVKEAPVFRRPALREAATVSIAGMYDRQYELLEECGLVDRVEEVYCRMKNRG